MFTSSIGHIILRVTFGYQSALHNDPFLTLAEQTMANFVIASTPGRWLVDSIPMCRWFRTAILSLDIDSI
jgi:hypothetical protein